MGTVTEGQTSVGLPYLKLGQGPPLVVAPGLSSEHANPTGVWRRMSVSWSSAFAEHFTVYFMTRRPGLTAGATLADIAADYAHAIENDIGQPVLLHGTSTGGSVALQLARARPELVQRMVVAAAACRLSPHGRQLTAQVARLTEQGENRRVSALLMGEMAPRPLATVGRGVGWVAGGIFAVDDPSDMLITMAAEVSFDAEPGLNRVQASTLVLGGTADVFYSADLFRQTAAGIAGGRAVILPGKSHMYVAGSKKTAAISLGFLLG